MINVQYAKNGQMVMAVKNYDELTDDEKEALVIPAGESVEDYANFQVRYNKKGQLLGVQAHDYSDQKKTEIEKKEQEPDVLDSLTVLIANKHTKAYQLAKKRLHVTNQQVNRAIDVINREA